MSSPARQPVTATLTIEAALSNANGDVNRALENVLNERNMLSSQNTQLWKLIEKQRAVHGSAIKELERVRTDRDRLVGKEGGSGKKPLPTRANTHDNGSGTPTSQHSDSPSPDLEVHVNGHRTREDGMWRSIILEYTY